MGRKRIPDYSGGVYHLIQRGNNREFIFERKDDKEYLLELVREHKQIMGYELYGFTIMDNHYHLIIRRAEAPLRDIMHRINNKFSRYYNRKNQRTGHVFENRYKGLLVIHDKYLLNLLRYIHQNPVCADICENIRDYPWSSDQYYREGNKQGIVDISFVLTMFSDNRSDAIKAYQTFMEIKDLEANSDYEDMEIVSRIEGIKKSIAEDACEISEEKDLDKILLDVTRNIEIYEEIKSNSRRRYLSTFKREFIKCALKENFTMREIGESLSISEAAVFKMNIKNNVEEENDGINC